MHIAALTCRSYYSLLRGSVSVQRLVKKAREYGYGAIALADVNAMYGAVDLYKAAEQVNIQPIIGVEILTDSQRAILLAENGAGYKNLCRITTARNLDANFDLIEQLRYNNKSMVCICHQPELLQELKKLFHRDYLFAACRGPSQVEHAKAHGIKPIACGSFNIVEDDDIVTAKLLAGIRKLSVAGSGPQDNCGFNRLICEKDFKRRFRDCPEATGAAPKIWFRKRFFAS